MDSRTRVPRWTPPLKEALKLVWRPVIVFMIFGVLGWGAFISTALMHDHSKDAFEMFCAMCAGSFGVLLGQLIAVMRFRMLPIFILGGIFAFFAFWVMDNLSSVRHDIPELAIICFVFFSFALPCGLLSLQHRWELFATFWPSIGWIGAVIYTIDHDDLAYDWSQNKVSAWRPLTLAFLGGFLVCWLFFLASKQAVRVELWQALSGTAARRVEKKEKPVVGAVPRKNVLPLLVVALLLLGMSALLVPFLWRTGRGDEESKNRGAPSEEPDNRPPRVRGPDFNGEALVQMMKQMASAAEKGARHLWPLLFLLLLYRPAKRALLLSHLKTPIVPTPPSERIENLWELVRVAAADANVDLVASDSVEQTLTRIRGTKASTPAVERAAEIYVRTRYGFTVVPGSPQRMRESAIDAASDLRKNLSTWDRVKNLWRPL